MHWFLPRKLEEFFSRDHLQRSTFCEDIASQELEAQICVQRFADFPSTFLLPSSIYNCLLILIEQH